jgi:hypothetical protein
MKSLSNRLIKLSLACLLTLTLWNVWIILPAYAQGPIYVDQNASGNNNGTTWNDAYLDLQDALSVAADGDEIWVATGVYTPGLIQSDTFTLTGGIALYGGCV